MSDKLQVSDAHELDKKVPPNLIIMYQGKPYITKGGLEWKANYLFGGGAYGVTTEIIEKDLTKGYVLAKAVFKTREGVEFSNYGEASKENVTNPQMQKHLTHLALTRAECRVLRMGTACGYTSWDEMDINSEKEIPKNDDDEKPANERIKETIKALKGEVKEGMTNGEAKILLNELTAKK